MIFDLNNSLDINQFKTRVDKMLLDKSKVELTKINQKRTVSQNSYLHVLCSLFGIYTGLTLEEAKTHLKRSCSWMKYDKQGEEFLRETRKMDTLELTVFIDFIRKYSSDNGLYLLTSEEYILEHIRIDREIESHKNYL